MHDEAMMRIQAAEAALVCPACKGPLQKNVDHYSCPRCSSRYSTTSGKVFFVNHDLSEEAHHDFVYSLKQFLKRKTPRLAFFIYRLLNVRVGEHAHTRVRALPPEALILNVGSGAKPVDPRVVNIDFMPEHGVDVVANAYALPFKDMCADMVISESLLEHLEYPAKAIDEMRRVLKPGGEIFIVTPFVFGVHSSPDDYHRWTLPGMTVLLSGFTVLRSGVAVGPTGAFAAITREWLAIVLSFNISFLYHAWLLFFMVVLIPLNIFDYVLSRYHFASQIAMEYYWVARKK